MTDVAAYFDARAGEWDAGTGPDADFCARVAQLAGARGARVLDVGCGTGVMASPLFAEGAAAAILVDVSPEMCRLARNKCALERRARVFCADACALPDALGVFGAAVVFNAYAHFPEPEKLAASLARRLSPGARLVVAHEGGRAALQRRHLRVPEGLARPLLSPCEETRFFGELFAFDLFEDTEAAFVFSGVRTNAPPPRGASPGSPPRNARRRAVSPLKSIPTDE